MTEIVVHRLTRKEKVTWMDGNLKRTKWVTLYSYDAGETWGMNEDRAQMRFKRASQLHPKIKQKALDRFTIGSTSKEAPVKYRTERTTKSMLGTARGKRHRFRRNLRRR